MSTIKGGGDFPKNQPISGKQGKTLKTEDTASPFQITDGLVLSGSGLSEKTDEAQTNTDPTHLWRRDPDLVNQPLAKGLSDAQGQMGKPLDVIGFDTCLMAEVDGQFLTGPGVGKATASGLVSESASAAGVSEFTFTNGIHSRQLIGLNGQVLADANPFR